MATPQGYIPSFSELMTPADPNLGTVQPGFAHGKNEGLDHLFQAATQVSQYRWLKHKEILDRKANYFKTLTDLSQAPTMAEDREVLGQKMKGIFQKMLDPDVLNGRNEQANAEFEQDILSYGADVARSKQDLLNYEIDKKVIAEHPEYQNNANKKYIEGYKKLGLGNRRYDALIPTPKFDFKPIIDAASVGVVTPEKDEFEVGRFELKDGKQVFTPDPNGTHKRTATGGTLVNDGKFKEQFQSLVKSPIMAPAVKSYLDFLFESELTPELKKSVTKEDGTPDYDKMTETIMNASMPQAVPKKETFEESELFKTKYREQQANVREDKQQAGANTRERWQQEGADRRAKWANETEVTKAASKGDGVAQGIVTDAEQFANRVYETIKAGEVVKGDGKSKILHGIRLSGLSDADKEVLGLVKYGADKVAVRKYNENDDNLIAYIGPKGGIAIATIDADGKVGSTKESLSKESMKSSRITYAVQNSGGKEVGAYNPDPGAVSTGGKSTTTTTTKTRTIKGYTPEGLPIYTE